MTPEEEAQRAADYNIVRDSQHVFPLIRLLLREVGLLQSRVAELERWLGKEKDIRWGEESDGD